jgi:hypothetical protein
MEFGVSVYEERKAKQARLQQEQEERLEAIHRETARRNEEYAKAGAEKERLHTETMARMRGRVALVTNFARNTGAIAPPLIGKNLAAELAEKSFEHIDMLVVEALIHGRKLDRLDQFRASADAVAQGALTVGLAKDIKTDWHMYTTSPYGGQILEAFIISERIRHHEAQFPDRKIGYIAAGSALELDTLGFAIDHTILGASGEVYERIVDGGVIVPDDENPNEWKQIIPGNQIALLPKDVREADWRSSYEV